MWVVLLLVWAMIASYVAFVFCNAAALGEDLYEEVQEELEELRKRDRKEGAPEN